MRNRFETNTKNKKQFDIRNNTLQETSSNRGFNTKTSKAIEYITIIYNKAMKK